MPITKHTKANTVQISIRAFLSSTMELCGQTIISNIDSSHQEIIRWLEYIKELPQVKESERGVSFILESNTPLPEGFQQDLKDQCERLIANSKIFFNISSITSEKNNIEISEEIYEEAGSQSYFASSPRQSVTKHPLSIHTDDDKAPLPHSHPVPNVEQQDNNFPSPPSAVDLANLNATASNLPLEQIQVEPASETVKNLGDSITHEQLLNLLKQETQKAIFVIDKKIKNAKLPFSISTAFEDTKGRKISLIALKKLIEIILDCSNQDDPDQPLTQELGELIQQKIHDFCETDDQMKARKKTRTITKLFVEFELMFQNVTYVNAAVNDDNGSPFPPPPPPLLEQGLLSLELTQFSGSELPLPPPPSPMLLEDQQQLELTVAQPHLPADSPMAYMAALGARLREKRRALGDNNNSQPAPPLSPKSAFSADDVTSPSPDHKVNGTNPSPTPPPPSLLQEQELLNVGLIQFSDNELPFPPPPSPTLLEDQQQLELTVAQPDSPAVLRAKPQESQHPLANKNNSQPPPPLPPKPVFLADDLSPPNSGNAKPPLPPKPPLTADAADDLTSSGSAHAQCASGLTTNKAMTLLEEIQQKKRQGLRNTEHSHPWQEPTSLDLNAQILKRRQDMQQTGSSDSKPTNLTQALLFQCSQMNIQRSQSNSSNSTNDNNDNWSDDWSDGASSPPNP
ncbi:hypothetical protein [Piscirickettsia salmonis]|uniref:hypothetical protein n=1 Tax=Piscirickettsia salmonis TaxID=1238 RepID=UPI0007C90CE0|nr:hypothetical protein A0O36_02193 [Piscirickettsiaceae bacterium NZ-RLO1]